MIVYDNEREAIFSAKQLEITKEESVSVILSKGEYFVECPAADLIRVFEKLIYETKG
jgi:hypothetical protein